MNVIRLAEMIISCLSHCFKVKDMFMDRDTVADEATPMVLSSWMEEAMSFDIVERFGRIS